MFVPPTRRQSNLRSLTNSKNRLVRFALVVIIALAGTVLATTNSSASALGRMLYARAAKVIAGGATVSETKAAHAEHAFANEATESASMANARRAHTATRLADGRVLIAGGENAAGLLNASEIYEPATASFSATGNMNEARADHSATLLADGRVLIIGGRNAAGSLSSTEIYDPATGTFASGPSLGAARAGHTATVLAGGRVLVVGGDASGSAEVIDAALTGSTATGALNVARSLHSAALLQDGRVVIVGGRDASGNQLSSAEVFDTTAGSFSTIDGTLQVARVRPHLRVLFDGKVQIIGGNSDRSLELYDPLAEVLGGYAHVLPEGDPCTGLAGHILASQTRAALFHNGQTDPLFDRSGHTITELGGQALVIGGANSSGVALDSSALVTSSGAAVTTDKLDYTPGEIAYISGRGFQAGETVRLKVHEDPHTPQERGLDVVADGQGNFTGEYLVTEYDLDMKFLVGARGLTSGFTAQTAMTDSNPQAINVAPPISVTVTQGATAVFGNLTVTKGGNNDLCNINLSAIAGGGTGLPAGATAVFGTNPLAMTTVNVSTSLSVTTTGSTAPGTYTFRILGTNSLATSGCQGPGPGSSVQLLTLIVNAAAVNTTTAVTNATATYGDASVTLNATVTPDSGPAVNAGSVTFTVKQGATIIGVATTDTTIVAGAASVSYLLPAGTPAGPYTIEASYSGATGFNASSGSGALTINQKGLTITASNKTKTYGDAVTFDESTPSTDFSVVGLINADTVDSITLTSTGAAATATVSGSPYAITPSAAVGTGLGNYDISYVNGSLTVDPRPLTITANNKTKVYGDAVVFDETTPSTDFSVSGLVNSDTVDSITLTSAGAAATATVSGSPYTIIPSAAVGTGLGNYNISYVNGSLTVDPRPLTITANNKTKTYGDTVVFDETTPSTDFSVSGLVNSDTVDSVTLTSAGAAATATVSASPYAIIPSAAVGTGLGNYNISYVNGSLTVDPRPLTITASNKTKVYGDTVVFDETTPSTDFSVSGLVNADTVDSVTLTSAGAAATATVSGSPYAIIPSDAVGTGLGNYNISYVNGSLTVDPRPLTITANNKTKVYGDTVVFDESTPSTDFSVAGLVNADTVDSVTLTSAGAAATATVSGSPYAIVPSAAVGTGLGNYNISYVNGSLTVDPRPLTITANNKTKTYGDTVVFDETTPSTDFSVSGLVNSDTVDSVTLTSAGAAATATVSGSPYAIVPSAAVGTGLGNYNISYVNGSLTVDPRPLTITASNKTKVYGDTVVFDETTPSTDFSVSGLVNADTVDSVTLTSAGAAATATVSGSPYAIIPSAAVGTGLGNYNISYVNGSLTVDPRPLTITANNKTKVYGDTVVFDETTPSTDFSVSGLVNADTVDSVTLTSSGAAATATVSGSPYTIVPSAAVGTGLGNYNISYVNGSLTVDPRPLTITASNKTKVYGDTVVFDETTPSTDFSVSGLVNADTVDSVTLTSAGAAATATVSGSPYAIVPSAAVGTGLDNYSISYVNGSLTVDPRPLTITASNKSKTYGDTIVFDETTPSTDFSVAGLANSDTVASITLTSAGAAPTATVAGSPYAISPSNAVGTGLDNYNISYVNGSLTVNQRPLTITASNKTKTYGDTVVFDETTPSTDFTVGALVNSDTVDSITLTSAGAAAGAPVLGSPYSIVPSAAVGTGVANYNITYVNGTLTVNKASLTITASSHTVTFGDAVPTITPSYAGFVAGDDPTDLTTQPTCSTTYTVGSLVGTYPTKCENAASSNYDITYVNGTVTVLTACSAFNGFLAPIGGAVENLNGGSFGDPVRAFKLNSTIPVKFSATCFGAPLTTGIHTLQAIKYSNSTTSDPPVDATPTDAATTGNQFRLADGHWHFNLSTKGLGSNGQGIWLLKATLFDGSTYTVWITIKK